MEEPQQGRGIEADQPMVDQNIGMSREEYQRLWEFVGKTEVVLTTVQQSMIALEIRCERSIAALQAGQEKARTDRTGLHAELNQMKGARLLIAWIVPIFVSIGALVAALWRRGG